MKRGTASARSVAIARKGIRNLLIHAGMLAGSPELARSVTLDMPDGDCYVIAEHEGLLEPRVDLGERVAAGDVVARVWPLDRTGVAPIDHRARRGGLLASRHFPGLVRVGDCVAVVAAVVGEEVGEGEGSNGMRGTS